MSQINFGIAFPIRGGLHLVVAFRFTDRALQDHGADVRQMVRAIW